MRLKLTNWKVLKVLLVAIPKKKKNCVAQININREFKAICDERGKLEFVVGEWWRCPKEKS